MTGQATLHDAIMPKVADLSPALRNAADYVIRHPDSVAMLSLRRIARESKLPPTTFSRLAKSLDFDSYEALRDLCRDDIRQRAQSFADKAETLQTHAINGTGSLLKRHAAVSIANIEKAVETIDGVQLAALADLLTSSRTVFAYGSLSSRSLIEHVIYSARLALPNWRVAEADGGSVATAVQDIGPDDAVLILSQYPYARSSVTLAKGARRRGATLVAITDNATAPIAELTDKALVVPTGSPHFFASEVATVLLLETLLSMVVQRTGLAAKQRIAVIEAENYRSGEYWQGDPDPPVPKSNKGETKR